jgi:hypothetical protein
MVYALYLYLRASRDLWWIWSALLWTFSIPFYFLKLKPKSLVEIFILSFSAVCLIAAAGYRIIKSIENIKVIPKPRHLVSKYFWLEFLVIAILFTIPPILAFKNFVWAFIGFGIIFAIVTIIGGFLNYYEKRRRG